MVPNKKLSASGFAVGVLCYSLNCMAGMPGNYQPKPFAEWPEPVAAADEDMASWAQSGCRA